MYVSAEFTAPMFTNYLILSIYQFYYVFGEKPHCKGDPLNTDEFSSKEHVGFVRDIFVDVIARNLYNTLDISPSIICEELANIRTSTCSPKCLRVCIKWKRSRFYNNGVTNQIMDKALALMEHFNDVVWKNAFLYFDEEKLIFESIADAERRLIDSKAVTIKSQIMDEMRSLKINFCPRYSLNKNQTVFQLSIGKYDEAAMKNLNNLVRNDELGTAIKLFIRIYEAENVVQITNFYVTNDLSHKGLYVLKSIPHLKFEYNSRSAGPTMSSSVFMKIPSLSRHVDEDLIKNLCHREAHFYNNILPKLYRLGKCNPFAPLSYVVTEDNAVVLADLSARGYKHGDRIELLNLNQIEKALELMAKFHALSYKYLQIDGKDDLTMSLIRSFPLSIIEGGDFLINGFYRIVEPSLTPSLYEKVMKMKYNILDEHLTKKREEENSMNVIIHGDFRIRNILFKNDNEPKLINWQLSRETSPAVDLIYFFITSVPIEIFETHDNALKDFYLKELNSMLSAVQSGRSYDRTELDNDIIYYKYYYLRVLSINRQHLYGLDDPGKEEEAYKSSAPKWVNYFEKTGIIE